MKILWLDINSSYAHSSLAIPSLHAQLPEKLENSVEWRVLSATVTSEESTLINKILIFNPNIILSTQWLFNKNFSIKILSKVSKLINPLIVLGGPEFLGNNETFLRTNSFITAVFRGDGEEIFSDFVQKLKDGDDWKLIHGFCYIDKSNYYVDNGKCITRNFNSLNIPEDSKLFCWDKPFVQLETSRGCFNNCTFCISGIDKGVQNIKSDHLEKRINFIYTKGIKDIRVLDRTFNADEKRAIELLNIFRKFSGKIRFHLEVHPAFLGKDLRNILNSLPSNLLHIEAGIQSLNDEVIKKCKRAGKNSDVIEGLSFLVNLKKFVIHTDLIAGLPDYSLANIISDIKLLTSIGPDEIQLELLKLLPGTELRNNYKQYKLKFSSEPPYEVLSSDSSDYKDLQKALKMSEILDTWYNNKIWQSFILIMISLYEKFLENLLDFIDSSAISLNSISKEYKASLLFEFIELFYPESSGEIAEYWIQDGLSLKKGPGCQLKEWKSNYSGINIPINNIDFKSEKYYFLIKEKSVIWFVYNKSISREKPIKIFHQNIINH